MADYNPNQFQPKNTNWEVDKLKKEVDALKAEIRQLKGIKTYSIDVTYAARYTVEAADEKEASDWYDRVGKNTEPVRWATVITNIKEVK